MGLAVAERVESTLTGGSADARDDDEPTALGDEIAADELAHADLVQRGRTIGRYVVVEKLGSGAMGTVYRAYDPELDRGIALKLVSARGSRWKRPAEMRARIMREAQAIAQMQHPNVVQVFDVGEVDYAVWVAMEFVDGSTIKQWARQPGRTSQEVVDAFLQAGRGLAAAHRVDIIHRDFKPENVMIGRDGRVRVLDFGLARAVSGPSTRDSAALEVPKLEDSGDVRSLELSLTAHGVVMGTPAYMAPEQHLGKPTGAASDQFSFCVSLWEALYGQRPFQGDSHATLALAATRGRITPPPDDRGVPRWLHTVILRGLEPIPGDRHPDMDSLVIALQLHPTRRRRRLLLGAGFVVAVAGTAVVVRAIAPAADDRPCSGASIHFDGIWDDARRQAVASAFAASELPFASDAATSVTAALDAWRDEWIDAHTEACRATRVLGEQSESRLDLRMQCLQRHLTDLRALVDLLQTGQREVVVGSIDAARNLPSIATCSDLQYLTARVPPPASPERSAELSALTETLAGLAARVDTGVYVGSREGLDAIAPRVEALDYPPLSAKFARVRGLVLLAVGETRDARDAYESAFAQCLRGGDTRCAAFAAAKLVFIIGHLLADLDGGQRWARLCHELVRALGDDGHALASLQMAEGSMLSTAGDYAGQVEMAKKVQAFWLQADPLDPQLGVSYGNLANAEIMRGNLEEGVRLHEQELAILLAYYGEAHPETTTSLSQLAMALSRVNRIDEAKAAFEKSIRLLRESEGDSSTRLATALDGYGRVLRQQGELEAAVQQHTEALKVWTRAVGELSPDAAVSLSHLGYTYAAMKKWDEALRYFERADEVFRKSVGEDHPQRIYTANARAQMHLELDAPERAAPIVEEALSLESADQVDPTLIAETKFILAEALWNSGKDRSRALTLAHEARDTYADGSEVWADDLAKIDAWLAAHPARP